MLAFDKTFVQKAHICCRMKGGAILEISLIKMHISNPYMF